MGGLRGSTDLRGLSREAQEIRTRKCGWARLNGASWVSRLCGKRFDNYLKA